MPNKKMLPILASTAAFIIWGLNTPLVKISLETVPSFLILFVKFSFGALVFGMLARKQRRHVIANLRLRIIIATLFGYVLTTIMFYQGIKLTGGLNASLLYLLAPLFLYFFSIKFLRERYNSKLLVGVISGLFGAALIISAPLLAGQRK